MPVPLDQASLFSGELPAETKPEEGLPVSANPPVERRARTPRRIAGVQPAEPSPDLLELAKSLPSHLWLGTSSWSFPGWSGLVWGGQYPDAKLSKEGLPAYSKHPLLQTVSLDRAFYRPLSVSQYAQYAAQVPDGFRFVVKAPSLVADAQVRSETGRGMTLNPAFLSPDLAIREFMEPALEGLGAKVGALVFQISPLPHQLLSRIPEVIEKIGIMLAALPCVTPRAPDGVVAIEVRDAAFLTATNAPLLARMLRQARATNPTTYCLGLHAKMPPIEDQLPLLRALWPGPLVCRWNLHRRHGAYGYEAARQTYEPFDRLVDPDLQTREALTRVIKGTTGEKLPAYITINNKAEGSAPLSVVELAKAVRMNSHQRQSPSA